MTANIDTHYLPFDAEKMMVEVTLKDPDSFLVITESLSRIGVLSVKTKTLTQSSHILHKQGRYYICNFKYLFALDGRETTITQEDVERNNTIARLLESWSLLEIVDPEALTSFAALNKIKILTYKEKQSGEYELKTKYTIGKKKRVVPEEVQKS